MFNEKCLNEIHNYFEIELRTNGRVKQKGYAQNIVLNNGLSSRMKGAEYIYVGSGEGELTKERTTLFNYEGKYGSKSTITTLHDQENKIYKKIIKVKIDTTELNGTTITELGTGSEYSLFTHAFIKDAEGNSLKLKKTELDELYITAVIFFSLNLPQGFIITNEKMVDIEEFSCDWLMKGIGNGIHALGQYYNPKEEEFTFEAINRVGTDESNDEIRYLRFNGEVILDLKNFESFKGIDVIAKEIGTGDNIKTEFEIPNSEPEGIKIYLNNNLTEDYSKELIENFVQDGISMLQTGDHGLEKHFYMPNFYDSQSKILLCTKLEMDYSSADTMIPKAICILEIYEDKHPEMQDYISLDGLSYYTNAQNMYYSDFTLYGGENVLSIKVKDKHYNIVNNKFIQCEESQMQSTIKIENVITDYNFNSAMFKIQERVAYENYQKVIIRFNNPPLQNEKITADYHVNYIPKDSEHVLDLKSTLKFSAGAGS